MRRRKRIRKNGRGEGLPARNRMEEEEKEEKRIGRKKMGKRRRDGGGGHCEEE